MGSGSAIICRVALRSYISLWGPRPPLFIGLENPLSEALSWPLFINLYQRLQSRPADSSQSGSPLGAPVRQQKIAAKSRGVGRKPHTGAGVKRGALVQFSQVLTGDSAWRPVRMQERCGQLGRGLARLLAASGFRAA